MTTKLRSRMTHARYWNKVHSKFRSRIERKFSALERWRWLKQTSFSAPVVAKALRICVSLEAYVGFRSPLPYPQEVDATKWWERMLSCVCQPKDPRNVAAAKAWRTTTVRQLFADGYVPTTRRPQKRARTVAGEVQWPRQLHEFLDAASCETSETECE